MSTQEPRFTSIDSLAVNTIRVLSAEAIQRANSGHPGMPMGAAPMAYVLWSRHLRFNPRNPDWADRDRFVLSAGHGSMLLYSLLHLTGYDLTLADIKDFRQWGSRTPGHPEFGETAGVETTTGPLGQGFGNGVGMALAEARLAQEFNRGDLRPVGHHTFVLAGDGDLMEGVQAEAASLAGHLGLGKLIVLYDDNRITIDGATDLSFSEDVAARFEAYGWHTHSVADGNDLDAIDRALELAKGEAARPSLVSIRTRIGFGSPNKENSSRAHGEPLGADELALTKAALGWEEPEPFFVPAEVRAHLDREQRGAELEQSWNEGMHLYREAEPRLAAEFDRRLAGSLPAGWDSNLPSFEPGAMLATRGASGQVLNALAAPLTELMGGSADLAGSNKTLIADGGDFSRADRAGRNIHFGIREHAMGAVLNGMALHGGLRPYGGTFLIFSDYMRPSIRLAALMGLPVTYVFTHDSIAVGEDGPTHQPIEQVASLRLIPGLVVLRPGDANETREAWRVAAREPGPVALVLTRQKIPVLESTGSWEGLGRGGYLVAECTGDPEIVLIASGSELHIALAAHARLSESGVAARVVSMPSQELFERQSADYRESIVPAAVACLAVEAGSTATWRRYAQAAVGIDRFGASAPGDVNLERFGFTAENVVARARELLADA
jgi:transketolase